MYLMRGLQEVAILVARLEKSEVEEGRVGGSTFGNSTRIPSTKKKRTIDENRKKTGEFNTCEEKREKRNPQREKRDSVLRSEIDEELGKRG